MPIHTIKTYYFDELPENVQRKAYEKDSHNLDGEYYNADFRATLEAFEEKFDISVKRWEVDSSRYTFDFDIMPMCNAEEIRDPIRLAVYMWNNYGDIIRRGKYYSTSGRYIDGKYTYKQKRSKALYILDDAALTGCFCDGYILQPIINCLTYKTLYETFDDLITDCLNNFFETWRDCLEYAESFDFYKDEANANEWEYLADGTKWRYSE